MKALTNREILIYGYDDRDESNLILSGMRLEGSYETTFLQ